MKQSQLPTVSTRLGLILLESRLGSGSFFIMKMKISARHQKLGIIYITTTYIHEYTHVYIYKFTEFYWNSSLEQVFNDIKDRICTQTTLVYYDPQSTLQADASGYGVGATLLQEGRPVAFSSKSFSPAENR